MIIEYAIDRLYATGWEPAGESDVETLADGRRFPSVVAVTREFERAGLVLDIKHTPAFNCYRATWAPTGQAPDPSRRAERFGTVIGLSECEAAVYALAQLRAVQAELQSA